jgi:hypothetical protein
MRPPGNRSLPTLSREIDRIAKVEGTSASEAARKLLGYGSRFSARWRRATTTCVEHLRVATEPGVSVFGRQNSADVRSAASA